MMAISKGICSDEVIELHVPYLARDGKRYLVIYPYCLRSWENNCSYRDAVFCEYNTTETRQVMELSELARIT